MFLRYAILHTMAIFETSEQLYSYMSELFEELAALPEVREALESLTLSVRFNYTMPDCVMTLTILDSEYTISRDAGDNTTPDVELTMTGDVAYRFWTGELNVMGAITTREIGIVGSLGKIMRLSPLIKAAIRHNKKRG